MVSQSCDFPEGAKEGDERVVVLCSTFKELSLMQLFFHFILLIQSFGSEFFGEQQTIRLP